MRVRAAALEADTCALYLACRDPRVPWPAKLIAVVVVGYALSPIDLIPDFIALLGHVDDLLIVPLGLALATRLIPGGVLAEHRARAVQRLSLPRSSGRVGIVIVLDVWTVALVWLAAAAARSACWRGC